MRRAAGVAALAMLAALGGSAARNAAATAACSGPWTIVPAAGVLHGDVDGDGSRDTVTIRRARAGPLSCRYRVAAATRHRLLTAAISAVDPPKLALLARIAPRGLAVVPQVGHGASTGVAAIFVVSGGRLQEVRKPGLDANEFLFGGSVTHFSGITCSPHARSGGLVLGDYFQPTPSSRQVEVDRTFYRLSGSRLVLLRTTSALFMRAALERRNYPEFRGTALFPTCTAAR